MLRDLVVKNRSYRGFDESYKFTREQLLKYVDLTRYTASGVNLQPLKFHIVCEKEEVDKIQPLTNWAKALKNVTLPHEGMNPTAFIIICEDKNIAPTIGRFNTEIGIVAQTILLAAVEEGLGGCMIGNFKPEVIKETLSLDENIEPILIIALGKPMEKIVITDVGEDGTTTYYRDENDVHYVPKRKLEDIIC